MGDRRKTRVELKEQRDARETFGPGPGWSVKGVVQGIGVATGLGAGLYWLNRISRSDYADAADRQSEIQRNNEAWKHREDAATARGSGRFANMRAPDPATMNAWEEFHQRSAAGEAATGTRPPPAFSDSGPQVRRAYGQPLPSSGGYDARYADFDARMNIKEAAAEAELWAKYPEEMAQQARERAAATGEPLDPRAQRSQTALVRQGASGVSGPPQAAEAGAGASGARAGGLVAEPGIDIDGMKRAKPTPAPVAGVGGWVGRAAKAAPWAMVGWELFSFGRDWKAKGFVGAWKERHPEKDAEGFSPETPGVVKDFVRQNLRKPKQAAAPPAASGAGPGEYPDDAGEGDSRDSVGPGGTAGVPKPVLNPNGLSLPATGGWGDAAPRKKKGKPFKDPHGIGQARLQAEADIAAQNAAERRAALPGERALRYENELYDGLEKDARKKERDRVSSERRQIDFENDSAWLAQQKAWEEKRVERGSRRRRSPITANSWQAAGAVVGGFGQINVELVRSEIERVLERGDAAIRMD